MHIYELLNLNPVLRISHSNSLELNRIFFLCSTDAEDLPAFELTDFLHFTQFLGAQISGLQPPQH